MSNPRKKPWAEEYYVGNTRKLSRLPKGMRHEYEHQLRTLRHAPPAKKG